MKQLKEHLGLVALIVTLLSTFGGGYVTLRIVSEREAMQEKFVLREVWKQESEHQREMLAEVKATVTETNRTVNEFIRSERHSR